MFAEGLKFKAEAEAEEGEGEGEKEVVVVLLGVDEDETKGGKSNVEEIFVIVALGGGVGGGRTTSA